MARPAEDRSGRRQICAHRNIVAQCGRLRRRRERLSFTKRPNNALDTLTEGIGSGMVRFGRGAGNVLVKALNAALPDSAQITGGPFSDAALREQDELDRPVCQSTLGTVGQIIGQTAHRGRREPAECQERRVCSL